MDEVPPWLIGVLFGASAAIWWAMLLIFNPLRPRLTLFRDEPDGTWAAEYFWQKERDDHDLACRTEDAILDAVMAQKDRLGAPPERAGGRSTGQP